jgi:hypothetical protein
MTMPATHQTRTGRLRGEKHEVLTLSADRLASRTGRWRIRAAANCWSRLRGLKI